MRVFEIRQYNRDFGESDSCGICAEWDHVQQWLEARGIVVEIEFHGDRSVLDSFPSESMVSEKGGDLYLLLITDEWEFRKELLVRKGVRLARRRGGDASEWRRLFKEYREELRLKCTGRFWIRLVEVWQPGKPVKSYVETDRDDDLGVPYDEDEIDQTARLLADVYRSTNPEHTEHVEEIIADYAKLAAEGSLGDALLLSRFRELTQK
ncbi:MAG: hypothetical protein K2X29_04740 [Candidatus Obscuribacterales bacterium]|nr:hypothetical protein [Candidatus Obscuribacterales bacterium]